MRANWSRNRIRWRTRRGVSEVVALTKGGESCPFEGEGEKAGGRKGRDRLGVWRVLLNGKIGRMGVLGIAEV